jgi:hypothetical protein
VIPESNIKVNDLEINSTLNLPNAFEHAKDPINPVPEIYKEPEITLNLSDRLNIFLGWAKTQAENITTGIITRIIPSYVWFAIIAVVIIAVVIVLFKYKIL